MLQVASSHVPGGGGEGEGGGGCFVFDTHL